MDWLQIFDFGEATVAYPLVAALSIAILGYMLREQKHRRYIEHLYFQAITDGMTGLHNQTYFLGLLDNEVNRALRYKHSLSLLMIDIDHFKQYNDKFGHQQGDDLIRRLVHVMRTNVRRADSIARYGGEEFVVLMPDTNMKAAMVVAERLRKRVEKTRVLNRDVATISVGISTLESFDESISPALLLRGADDAMYEAKQAGRNVTRTKALLIKEGDKEE